MSRKSNRSETDVIVKDLLAWWTGIINHMDVITTRLMDDKDVLATAFTGGQRERMANALRDAATGLQNESPWVRPEVAPLALPPEKYLAAVRVA